jgi:uncharacterized protein (TIGR02118 family)
VIKVSVMYKNGAGNRFDMQYYVNNHIPMVQRLLGPALKGVAVEQGMAGGEPGEPPTYLAFGHLIFDSVETFQTSFGPHGDAIRADVANYTNTHPVIQISEIKL